MKAPTKDDSSEPNSKLLGSDADGDDLDRFELELQCEFWRVAHQHWQEWGTQLLRDLGLQPKDGLWGDAHSMRIIARLARRGFRSSAERKFFRTKPEEDTTDETE